jgi:hypothetical protein
MRTTVLLCLALTAIDWTIENAPSQPPGSTPAKKQSVSYGLALSLLNHAAVQKELKMNDEQIKAIKSIRSDEPIVGGISKEEADKARKQMQALNDATEMFVKDKLRAEQQTRLFQLLRQFENFGAFLNPDVQAQLDLSDEQIRNLKAIGKELATKQSEIRAQPGNFIAQNRKTVALSAEYVSAGLAVLTEGQKAIWEDVVGVPFDLSFARPGSKAAKP